MSIKVGDRVVLRVYAPTTNTWDSQTPSNRHKYWWGKTGTVAELWTSTRLDGSIISDMVAINLDGESSIPTSFRIDEVEKIDE